MSPRKSGVQVVTFGCRLNALESEVLRERLAETSGEVVIFNTCAVTAEAQRQARQAIRKARRETPAARIVVTGCAAQVDPESFAAMPEVDRVVGNTRKLDPIQFLDGEERVRVEDIMTAGMATAVPEPKRFAAHTRAFVQVQQGCDHRCAFCIIPFARGPARSFPEETVVARVRAHVAAGHAEAVLTGVDISSYGNDLPDRPSLGALVRRLLAAVPDLQRLRLSSLDPAVMDAELLRALAEEERLMPHLHLSLQSLDDMILKRMKRRHGRADAFQFIARARAARPGLSLGADLIAGFPTETEAMFAATLAGVEDSNIPFLHVFPYSPRAGTPAARMPAVAPEARKIRAARLRRAGAAAMERFLESRVGAIAEVLVEKGNTGRTPDYAPVRLALKAPVGAIVRARLARVAGREIVGESPP
ncbi:MAG: tRNA (N(6)-L-threonylcarbamoyladenosine(37)-C(2))-methylthiotransferase MtaB [Rhodospirillales bacterium]|nr:tRNA (N(6)-L-threonylcarbamoyladenosine(37)-C(2))-methylthiotransferase MtaB [Rhodospirillales bacterium]MSP80141.1 tRNA (N(6)-L-threonylcarbamoyladenosine(37)-C(2))-methylthiotransferase MtaB [Rhodospirillales bacterium]